MVVVLVVKNLMKLNILGLDVKYLMEFNVEEIVHLLLKIFLVLNILHIILFQHFYIQSFWVYLLLIDFLLDILELLLEK